MQLYIYFISSYAKADSRVDRQQLFFASKAELSTVCEMLRAWRDNFGTGLNALIPAKVPKLIIFSKA